MRRKIGRKYTKILTVVVSERWNFVFYFLIFWNIVIS